MTRVSPELHIRSEDSPAIGVKETSLVERVVMALEGATVAVWDYHVRTGDLWVSDGFLKVQGYSREEALRHPNYPHPFLIASDQSSEYLHPDDVAEVEGLKARLRAGEAGPFEVEHRLKHKLGHWVWVLQRVRVISADADGFPLRLVGIRSDITQRREAQKRALEAEEELRQARHQLEIAAEAASLGVWEWDPQRRTGRLSPAAQRICGLTRVDSFDFPSFSTIVHPLDLDRVKQELGQSLKDDDSIESEFRIFTPSGDVRWLYCAGAASAAGAQWTGIVLDVTDRKTGESRLAEAQREINDAQIRTLRYQINPHFLFNTLNSLAALIGDGDSVRAEEMVLKLASFYRASLKTNPLQKITLGEEIALAEAYLCIEKVRFPDELSICFDVPDELGDALVPCLILQPLLENAVKYGLMAAGSLMTIQVRAEAVEDDITLSVRDNGRGSKAPAGTGIGLQLTEQRLTTVYGSHHRFCAGPMTGGGFEAILRFPLEFVADIMRLREEHKILLGITDRLRANLADEDARNRSELMDLRHDLRVTLSAHLRAEDKVLYPRLIRSANFELAKLARRFSEEMGSLALEFSRYDEKWHEMPASSDWGKFREDTLKIVDALVERIEREDSELYPLIG